MNSLLITTLIFMALFAFSACKKKKLGESCTTNKDCESGSRCLTVEGKNTCTKLCSKDEDCPKEFACAKLNVRYGHSATAIPQKYCLSKTFLAKADQKVNDRMRVKQREAYKKLKESSGEKLSTKQQDHIRSFLKKYRVGEISQKTTYMTLLYFSSYGSLWTKTMDDNLKKENKLWKGKLRIFFFPIPFDGETKNNGLMLGYDLLKKKGNEEFWRFHKKYKKLWSTADRPATVQRIAKKLGVDKKALAAIIKSKESTEYVKALTELKEILDLEKDPVLIVGEYKFKGNDARNKLEVITLGYHTELLDYYKKNPPKKPAAPDMTAKPEKPAVKKVEPPKGAMKKK
ncbi:hypothetical protein KKF84_03760 [Myxococcota bacterium]|nr:hypothetical protein [Myxococcota bacterium]